MVPSESNASVRPSVFESERLRFVEFSEEDAEGILALNADPEVLRYTGDVPFATLEEARTFLRGYDAYARHGMGRWTALGRVDSQYLGWCGLKLDPERDEVDLGFRFLRSCWGRGLATEAGWASLDRGFAELGLVRIVGRAQRDNLASHRVLEKLGMHFAHTFEEDGAEWWQYEIDAERFARVAAPRGPAG